MEMNRLKRGGRGWRESLKHSLEYSCLHLCIQYPVQMFLCFVNLDICPFFLLMLTDWTEFTFSFMIIADERLLQLVRFYLFCIVCV